MRKRVHDFSILVERTYLTSDSDITLYLLRVHPESRKIKILKRVRKKIRKAKSLLIRLSISFIIAVLAGILLIPAVEAQRGYVAYGGEYLFIGLIFWVTFKFSDLVLKKG